MSQSPKILHGLEAVRRKPGMYIGGTDERALNCCVLELIANSSLNAFIAVWLTNPYYGGATKDELINPEVERAVSELTARGVKRWAMQSTEQAKWLMESLDEDRRAKAAAKEG